METKLYSNSIEINAVISCWPALESHSLLWEKKKKDALYFSLSLFKKKLYFGITFELIISLK